MSGIGNDYSDKAMLHRGFTEKPITFGKSKHSWAKKNKQKETTFDICVTEEKRNYFEGGRDEIYK